MAERLGVRLLGPVRVRTGDGDECAVRGHAAHLLAWMALHPGRAWSVDDLARRLWADGPPPTARTAIQGHVSRLRRMLGPASPVQIETVPGGYVLRAGPTGGDTPTDVETDSATDTDAGAGAASDTGTGTNSGTATGTDSGTVADSGTGTNAGTGTAGTGTGTDARTDPGHLGSPIDAQRFEALCDLAARERSQGRARQAVGHLDEALDLWAGEALSGLRDEPALAAAAAALDEQRRDAEDALADALVADGETDRALALLRRLVNDDPLRERRWALLMTALTRAGRQTDALRAYRQAAAVLVDRTGLDPGHELQRLETAILLQDPSLDAARWQPAPGSAPNPLTGVVGREAERAAVVARLDGTRVVTLVGPGGVGKSTLGVDVGAAAADTFADGVVVVDLGSAGPDDVGAAVAAAVGAPAPGEGAATVASDPAGAGDPLARAVAVLTRRQVLIVLDGCEHVRAHAAQAAVDLLTAGPGVRILATSQVPLGVAGEAVVTLSPLDLPPPGADAAAAARSPAVQLLARRLDELACPLAGDADWQHAAAIVRSLDGLPLAIEIAAAAARTEPLDALARRLSADTSTVLDADPPVGAGRRRLGAALDAAVDRLDAETARVYALLSVFPGGFDTAGAAAVAGIDEADARAVTGRLAEASLVVLEGPGRERARLLRPVRAHAAARLGPRAAAEAHERLVAWCLTLAAELDESVHSPAQARVIARFGAELPSLRLVLRHLLDVGDIARAAALFEDLVSCWVDSPASPEALAWADELLAQADRLPAGPRARLEVAAIHAQYAFELIAARLDLAEQALGHAEAAGDRFATAAAQVQVAIGLGWRNADLGRAAALIDESRATMLDLGASYWSAVVLELRGLLALRRLDVSEGIATLEAAAAEHQRHGGPGDVAHALTFIGYARRAVGDLSGARRAFDEASRALGEVRVSTWLRATVGAAHAALALGDVAAAGAAFRAAHDRAVEIGDGRIVGTALAGLAAVARHEAADDRSVALLVAAADRALAGGDPTDAVTAAGLLAEMLVARGAHDEAAVLLGAATLVDDEVGVRVDFGLAHDLGPVRAAVVASLGDDRAVDLGGDGRVIGLAAAVRRAGEWLLDDAGFTLLDEATPDRPDDPATPAIPLPRSRAGRVTPAS